MRRASISAWTWTTDERTWRDPRAPAPDPDALDMIEAAVRAGWYGITTALDEHGLRCIAAAGAEIAIVTVRGLTMAEALRVSTGVRMLQEWSIANLAELVRQACELSDGHRPDLIH